MQRKEFKRALHYFRQAQQSRKYTHHSFLHPSSSTNHITQIIIDRTDAILKIKEAQVLKELKETTTALSTLESIPSKFRDFAVYSMLGYLYLENNLKTHAKNAFKEAFILSPLSIDIMKELIWLGFDDKTLLNLIQEHHKEDERYVIMMQTQGEQRCWYFQYITALFYAKQYENEKTMQSMSKLLAMFPKNVYLLTMATIISEEHELPDQAITYYHQLRKLDPYVIESMDRVAFALFQLDEEQELNKLASDLIASHPTRPEGYIAAGYFTLLKGEFDHALAFVKKVSMKTNAEEF